MREYNENGERCGYWEWFTINGELSHKQFYL